MRIERLNEMEQYILKMGTVSLENLAVQFNVSMNTVRRDIDELIKRGTIRKVYGGVSAELLPTPLDFSIRKSKNSKEKEIIGQLAAGLVEDGSSIYIDSGSTTPHLLHHLNDKNGVTVITHSLTALCEASLLPNLNIIALGGVYVPVTASFTAISFLDFLSRLSIQTAFVSATGVTLESGLTLTTYIEAEIKRNVVQHGGKIVLMADHSKFGHSSLISFCPFESLYAIITDCAPPAIFMKAIKQYNIRLIYPGSNG